MFCVAQASLIAGQRDTPVAMVGDDTPGNKKIGLESLGELCRRSLKGLQTTRIVTPRQCRLS